MRVVHHMRTFVLATSWLDQPHNLRYILNNTSKTFNIGSDFSIFSIVYFSYLQGVELELTHTNEIK